VNKNGGHKGPYPALDEVVETEDKVLLGKRRVLLPSPDASPYATEYQEDIDSQGIASWSFLDFTLPWRRLQKGSSMW
jgi:hypothetical protein